MASEVASSTASPPSGSPTRHWSLTAAGVVCPLLLVIAGTAVYANSLRGVFLFDDTLHIVNNEVIRQFWPVERLLRSSPARPLWVVSLALNYAWGGLDVTGYHALNIGIHVAAGLVLFGLIRRTLRLPCWGGRFAVSADAIAMASALLWMVHPLQTQAVTYVVQRCEAMMGLFFLLAMYCYVRGATAVRPWTWIWYTSSLAAYCLGMASKEVMATVLPVLWLYDRVFLAASWREIVRRRGWLHLAFAAPLVAAATFLIPVLFGGADATVGFGIPSVTSWEYARSQPGVILHYLRLSLWPDSQCLDYGWPIESRWLVGIILPSVAVGGLLLASVMALLRGYRVGFLGVALFLILAPTSSFIPFQDLCFEHRMYLPLACVTTAGALGGYALARRLPQRWGYACCAAALVCTALTLGGLTVARNRVYHSAVAMWMDVIEKTRHHRAADNLGRALNNLGDGLMDAGQVEQGVEVLLEAVKLNPGMAEIHGNLGRGLTRLGRLEEARRFCETAVQLDPRGARYRQQLGLLAAGEGRLEEAERQLRRALQLAPEDGVIETNLGQCLADQQRWDEAIACFRAVARRDPACFDARHRLAKTLAAAGRLDEAARQAEELSRQWPEDCRSPLLLGMIADQKGNFQEALTHLQDAVARDPKFAAAHLQAGNVNRKLGRRWEAMQSYEKAVALDEELAEAHNNLGGLLAQDEPSRAARHFQAAVKARPDFLEARFNLAATLARLGARQEAAEQYRVVLKLRPDFGPARAGLDALAAPR